jgi:hypothetical protein
MSDPYQSAYSARALDVLTEHFDHGANLYKFWASPRSVVRALLRGWADADHPSHLHYAWDLETACSLDEAIRETTRRAVALLHLDAISHPVVFEPGCGIGGGVVQVAQMFPHVKVIGLSLVEKQLEIGRNMALARGVANTDFVQGNYLSTPFPDAFSTASSPSNRFYTPQALSGPRCFAKCFGCCERAASLSVSTRSARGRRRTRSNVRSCRMCSMAGPHRCRPRSRSSKTVPPQPDSRS